jgi:transcriptional regulator with XRE-family HTH domain
VLIYRHVVGGTNRKERYMMQESLAERLRVLRAQQGLSLTEASEKIGVNRHTLRDLELGKREPYGPTIRKIAEGYGVPVAQLFEEPAVPLVEAPREAGPTEAERQRPSLDRVREVFAPLADGLNRYCARWEEKLPTLQGTSEEVADFFADLQDFRPIFLRVLQNEFYAIAEALDLGNRYVGESELPYDIAVGFTQGEMHEHSLMHRALERHVAVGQALAESIENEEAAESMRQVLSPSGV